MNRRSVLAACGVILAIFGVGAFAQTNALEVVKSISDGEAQVKKAEADRFAAMVKNDVATVDRLMAPELVYTHGDGRVIDKAAFLADMKTGDFKYVSITPTDLKVRIYGDTAVVTGGAGMQVVNKGAPATIKIRYTNVQLRRNGAWQMVAWQATRLPM